ncbi:hypothetical protein PTI98_010173 [Pleurotus ostreatus]|nr:hypothetical protein PTI98_010173 [Pleurotus ostreatus]
MHLLQSHVTGLWSGFFPSIELDAALRSSLLLNRLLSQALNLAAPEGLKKPGTWLLKNTTTYCLNGLKWKATKKPMCGFTDASLFSLGQHHILGIFLSIADPNTLMLGSKR